MRKISNFCGIFATLFVTTTMVLLASCSQDDDNYESDMYTLAEMGTRLGDPEPGGGDDEWGYEIQDNECGIWCLIHLKGGYNAEGQIRGIIQRNNIDISNGMYQSIMVMIGDSIGLGFQGYMNDRYGIVDTVTNDTVIVEEPGITVQKLIELGGTSGHLHNVIIRLADHYVVGRHIYNKTRRILIDDVNGSSEISFDLIKGVIW